MVSIHFWSAISCNISCPVLILFFLQRYFQLRLSIPTWKNFQEMRDSSHIWGLKISFNGIFPVFNHPLISQRFWNWAFQSYLEKPWLRSWRSLIVLFERSHFSERFLVQKSTFVRLTLSKVKSISVTGERDWPMKKFSSIGPPAWKKDDFCLHARDVLRATDDTHSFWRPLTLVSSIQGNNCISLQ